MAAPFKDSLGNGSGCVVQLTDIQNDGTQYTTLYKAFLTETADSGLPGAASCCAVSQGILPNTATNAKTVYNWLKKNIVRLEGGVYDIQKNFYINTTLTNLQVLQIMKSGNVVVDFIGHPDTVKLDATNDALLLDELI